ncbi:MAG: hypothetical protein OEM91_17190 [Hyphomicrobiales bacterium]|nr:hypothetical protein [Hyphomicrobiales bacterium]
MQNLILTRRALLAGLAAVPLATGLGAAARAMPVNASSAGVAIEGYDPVAYFKAGKPVRGLSEFTATHAGATWHFASAANRDAFSANPQAFAPQFGGYCAWAVSQGYTAKIDPQAWKIVAGKLYLNYSKGVQRRWAKDIPGNIANGDANWPGIRAKL